MSFDLSGFTLETGLPTKRKYVFPDGAEIPADGFTAFCSATNVASDTGSSVPVHPYILVVIAIIAVGYGVYEYRHDLGNTFAQFRANRAAR